MAECLYGCTDSAAVGASSAGMPLPPQPGSKRNGRTDPGIVFTVPPEDSVPDPFHRRSGKAEIAIAEVAEEEEMVDQHRAEPLAAWLTPFARSALGESIARHSHEKESIGRRYPLASGAARSACCPAPGRVPSHARPAGIGSAAGRAHYIEVIN
jgi:hypothetical protein